MSKFSGLLIFSGKQISVHSGREEEICRQPDGAGNGRFGLGRNGCRQCDRQRGSNVRLGEMCCEWEWKAAACAKTGGDDGGRQGASGGGAKKYF